MPPRRSRHRSDRRLAWLVWFALVFPVAQLATSLHTLSHPAGTTRAVTADPDGRAQPAADTDTAEAAACALCLLGAALTGGAPSPAEPLLALLPLAHPLAATVATGVGPAAPRLAYLSRAPPDTSR